MLSKTSTGKTLLNRSSSLRSRSISTSSASDSRPLELEDWLSRTPLSASQLWTSRASLKELLLTDVLRWRNWILGISPTDIRKTIRPPYEANMKALEELLRLFREARVPVLAYITPIRHDYSLPYDANEYQAFKEEAKRVSTQHSASFLDLDAIIPSELWSSAEIDYMHFQGGGHRLLASHIQAQITQHACNNLDRESQMPSGLLNKTPIRFARAAMTKADNPT